MGITTTESESESHKDRLKWIFSLSRTELLYIVIIIAVAYSAFNTAYLIDKQTKDDTRDEEIAEEQRLFTIEQNQRLLNDSHQSTLYLIQLLDQQNVIGNQSIAGIQASIAQIRKLQENLSNSERLQTIGIVRGFTTLLQDTDDELDRNKQLIQRLAFEHNITLPSELTRENFEVEGDNFVFNNGTAVPITDLFTPPMKKSDEKMGRISSFLGGPHIINESLPEYLR